MVVAAVVWPPVPRQHMPLSLEPYVELFCTLPVEGMLVPLSLNLLILVLCTLFGFKTRKFPENFNESKCIFLCVCSTLFLLVAFLPTYFTSFYAYHRSVLLDLCLVLNASVMLLCLFVPKIYALFYVDENDLLFYETSKIGPGESSATFSGAPRGVFVTRGGVILSRQSSLSSSYQGASLVGTTSVPVSRQTSRESANGAARTETTAVQAGQSFEDQEVLGSRNQPRSVEMKW